MNRTMVRFLILSIWKVGMCWINRKFVGLRSRDCLILSRNNEKMKSFFFKNSLIMVRYTLPTDCATAVSTCAKQLQLQRNSEIRIDENHTAVWFNLSISIKKKIRLSRTKYHLYSHYGIESKLSGYIIRNTYTSYKYMSFFYSVYYYYTK